MMKKLLLGLTAMGLFAIFLSTCKGTKTATAATETEQVVPGKVYVWLTPTAQVAKVEAAFAEYELMSKGPASRSEKKYLFHYGAELISTADLMQKLEAHRGVEKVSMVKVKKP